MSRAMSDPKAQLKDIISDGVAIDLYRVEEVLFLDELIGREAGRINAATFGAFFGSLQFVLGRFLVLQVPRIFEPPHSRYPIWSIPAAIAVLREHGDRLVIEQRPGLTRALCRAGASPRALESLSDPDLTRFVVDFFDRRMSHSDPEGVNNARALLALKTVRDKIVAHPEAIRPDQLPRATFADIDQLVALAKCFVGAVGFGYLSIAYEDDEGHYFVSSDAKRSTVCLGRLLEKAAVITQRDHRV
jgi:hypothetical protein